MKFASGQPLTDRERARCSGDPRKRIEAALKRAKLRRAATPSGARYDRPATPASRRLEARILGELEDMES